LNAAVGLLQPYSISATAATWPPNALGPLGFIEGEVYNYPAGGSAVAVFTGNFDLPLAVVAVKK
jgi:hypothetical protein